MKKVLGVACAKDITVDRESRTVSGVITMETTDRDGEVVFTRGLDLKNFRANPVVLFQHDPNTVIGTSIKQSIRKRDGIDQMVATTRFAETAMAEEVFTLLEGGFLRGFSIGMGRLGMEVREPTEQDCNRKPHIKGAELVIAKAELLEYSVVSIPAHQDALTEAANKGLIRESAKFFPDLQAEPKRTVVSLGKRPRQQHHTASVERVLDAHRHIVLARAYSAGRI